MDEKTFRRWQAFLFWLCHSPHIAMVILRMLVQYRRDLVIDNWYLSDDQFNYFHLNFNSMNSVWLKIGVYGCVLLFCCCCCCCMCKCSYRILQILYFIDFIAGMILICDIPLNRRGKTSGVWPVDFIDIGFLVLLGIMNVIDWFAIWLYKIGLDLEDGERGTPETQPFVYPQPKYNPLPSAPGLPPTRYGSTSSFPQTLYGSTSSFPQTRYGSTSSFPQTRYGSASSFLPARPPPRQVSRMQETPRNFNIEGLSEATIILSDGDGGIIFVREITGVSVSGSVGSGIKETQFVLITREAIERNPFNPEVYVLTETEVSRIDFGREQENVRRTLAYH